MPQIEQYLAQVQGLSIEEKTYPQLAEYVRKSIPLILVPSLPRLDTILQALELRLHSIGILGTLYAKLTSEVASDTLLALVQEFFLGFNAEQVRHIPDIFCELCHKYTSIMVHKREFHSGINVLSRSISSLRTSPSQLTSIHADLLQLCLLAQNFKPALHFLDVDVTDIAKENNTFDAKYFLLYYYYGGMIYAAMKKFNRSLYFFEVAITTPAQAVSQIVVESYKKYVLVSLILLGKVEPLPKYVSQCVMRFMKPMCSIYVEIASAYSSRSSEQFRELMTRHQEVLIRDRNMGLAKQALNSKNKRNIKKLTKTFLTLSLVDVANRCNLNGAADAEKYLVGMIEDGEIYAAINKRDGMVYFRDNPEQYDDTDVLQTLNKDLETSFDIHENVEKLDSALYLNPQYVQKVLKQTTASSWLHEDEGLGVGPSGSNSIPEVFPSIGGF